MKTVMAEIQEKPFQCPVCTRLFYFDNDYIRHKCIGSRPKWIKPYGGK